MVSEAFKIYQNWSKDPVRTEPNLPNHDFVKKWQTKKVSLIKIGLYSSWRGSFSGPYPDSPQRLHWYDTQAHSEPLQALARHRISTDGYSNVWRHWSRWEQSGLKKLVNSWRWKQLKFLWLSDGHHDIFWKNSTFTVKSFQKNKEKLNISPIFQNLFPKDEVWKVGWKWAVMVASCPPRSQ